MKSFNEILFEIYAGEEAAHDFHRRYNEQLEDLVFLLKKSKGKGKLPCQKVRASRLAKIWLDFGKTGVVRDEKGLDQIVDLILDNIARLRVSTEMMGRHTPIDSRKDLSDMGYEFTDEEWDVWMSDYFTHEDGSWLLSDYGLPKLEKLYGPLFYADTPEKKLYAVDRILNVIHQRSDLASLFVEGGTKTLLKISSQGGYSSIDELMLENILSESYGDIKKKKWKLEKLGFKYKNLRESIMDESLDKPSDIISDPKNNDRTLSDITTDFIQHGGEVNRGSYGVVLTKNGWNFALKIFNDDIPYLKFVRFCLKNSRPSFPKFLDKPRRIIPNFKREKSKYYLYVVKVEKLKPITNSEYLDIDFYINYGGVNFDEMPDNHVWNKTKKKIEEIEKKYQTINQFLVDYNFLMDNGRKFGSPDIGESNIMKRNNGEFVLNDPFWVGETPYQTHDRLMKSETDYDDYSVPVIVKGGEKLKPTKKPKVLPKVKSPEEDVPFEESVLKEGYNLPNDVDVELKNVAKFIGSLFRPIFKKRIEHGKQKHRSQIVMQHKHYFIADRYRNETKDLFVIKRDRKSGAIWGHTDFTIRSKRDIIPPIYLYITDGYSVSTSGMVNLDDNRVCILIDKFHFLQNISDSVDDLTDTLKHEIRHYFQVTDHKTNYVGTPKRHVLSTTSDFFGNVHDSNRSVRHHMRDIEFKTNVHTYAHYFRKYLNLNYAKKDWLDVFKKLITGKPVKNSQYMSNFLDNMEDMLKRDKPRWKQFIKEIYKEIFI